MIKPLGSLVYLRVVQTQKKEIAGLIIESRQEPTEQALVLSIPPKEEDIKVGDTVIIRTGVGVPYMDGKVVHKNDILAVVEA